MLLLIAGYLQVGNQEHLSFYQAIDMTDSQMLRVVYLQCVLAITPISPSHIAGQQGVN